MRILLVEDNPGDVRLLQHHLADAGAVQFQVAHTDRLSAGLERLTEAGFDAVLLDLSLPDSQGLNTLVRMHAAANGVPIVVLTSIEDEALGVQLVKAGAQDYLVKGQVTSPLLTRSLRYAVERRRTEEALKLSEQRFAEFMRYLPGIAFMKDADGRHTFANETFEQLFNLKREDWHLRTNEELFSPDIAARLTENDRVALAKGTPFQVIEQTLHDDGVHDWLVHKFPIRPQDSLSPSLGGIAIDITERKRVEEALRDREAALARFKSTLDQTHDCVFMFDPDSLRFLYCNQGAVEQVGYSEAELLTMTPLDINPEFTERSFCEMLQPLRDGRMASHVFETVHRHKDGHDVAVEVSLQLVREEGQKGRFVVVVHDLTDRKQAEEALRASEARFRMLVEATTDWMWEIDEQGRYTYCSPKIRDLLGYEPAEALGKTPFDFMPEEEARRVAGLFGPIAAARQPFVGIENTNRHKDGRLVVLECRGVPIIDANGALRGYRGFDQDITERKQADERLRLSEQRQELALSGANLGLWDWDVPSGKALFDARWCAMVGYSDGELEPHVDTWLSLLHPEDAPTIQVIRESHLKNETPDYEVEFRMWHKSGHWVWILARGRVVERDHAGAPLRMAGTHMDITERKRAEEALCRSERQLRTVLDALPVGIWFTDQSGKPVLSNPAAKQIWSGIKQVGIETAANDAGWWEEIGPSGTFHRWALGQSLTKGVSTLNETLDLECFDGRIKTIRNTTVPVQDETGIILGAIVLNEDITALRQTQEALKLTQFSVDHAVEGFFWIGPDARILNVNDAACRMLEYTRDELTTMTMYDIDPNFHPEIWSAHWEELKQKKSMTFESKHWSKTGRVLDTEVTINFLYYAGSEYNCAIMRDIGERKQANAALRVSEDRFWSIFQNEPECVKAVAPDGTLLVMNPAGLIMVGARFEEEVIGKSVLSLIYPDDRSAFQKLHQGVCSGESGSLQFRIKNLQAEVRWVDTHSVPLRDADGGVTAALSITRDITERKCIEETLSRRERDLRAAVEERQRISQDLHDGILQSLFAVGLGLEASKSTMPPRIRKTSGPPLDQAIKQLNCVMHEIRNFIAGLGSDLLQGKDLPAALKQMLASLTQNQAMRVRLAVEDRAAQAVSAEQSLNLFHVIQEAVSNCIRHGRAQEARVSLKMLKQGVRLSIRDDGRGFNPETAKGSGHGLNNMAARAQKIGGRFTVLSKVNEGTSIVLDLPKEAADVRR